METPTHWSPRDLGRPTIAFAIIAVVATLIAAGLAIADVAGVASGPWAGVSLATAGFAGAAGALSEAVDKRGGSGRVLAFGFLLLALLAGSIVLVILTVSAQGQPRLEVKNASVAAGDELQIVGHNFKRGELVAVRLNDSPTLDRRAAGDTGVVVLDITIPEDVTIPEDGEPGTLVANGEFGSQALAALDVKHQRAIAVWSNVDGDYDIYTIDPRGEAEPSPIMDEATDDRYPAWSPDGTRIAFARFEGDWDIWVMNADGSDAQQLTSGIEHERFPAWSPDGSQILFARGDRATSDLYVMRDDGTAVSPIVTQPGEDRPGSWSRNGLIAFWGRRYDDGEIVDDGDIFTVRPDGTDLTRLEQVNTAGVERSPSWSPNGRRLAFTGDRNGQLDIWLFDLDTGEVDFLTRDRQEEGTPVWSPDGQSIAYIRGEPGAFDIWQMNANGTDQDGLTTEMQEANYLDPSWGPGTTP